MADYPRLKNRQLCLPCFTATWQTGCTDFCLQALGWPCEHGNFLHSCKEPPSVGREFGKDFDPQIFDDVLLLCWRRWILMYRLAGQYTMLESISHPGA